MIGKDLSSFMNLINIDESYVDTRLANIFSKENLSDKNLSDAVLLLQYKAFVNIQDNDECNNDAELDFLVKILPQVQNESVDNVCTLLKIVLNLNRTSLQSKAEHLLQQILSEAFCIQNKEVRTEILLKVSSSILEIISENGIIVSLPFLEIPFDAVLGKDDKVTQYFLTSLAPKLFVSVTGYNILDKLWDFIHGQNELKLKLKVLSTLADFYIPVQESESDQQYKSIIVLKPYFWELLLLGLRNEDQFINKVALYLAKRAIDCIASMSKPVIVKDTSGTYISFNNNKEDWCNYFILLESLKEKQVNIVLPALQLFDCLKSIGPKWLDCLFRMGIEHDNMEVKLKCLERRLLYPIESDEHSKQILTALNDLDMFDRPERIQQITNCLRKINTPDNILYLLRAIPKVKWSPVALYYVLHAINIVSKIKLNCELEVIKQILIDIMNVPCNIVPVKREIKNSVIHLAANIKNIDWKAMTKIIAVACSSQADVSFENIKINDKEKNDFIYHLLETHLNIPILIHHYRTMTEDERNIVLENITKKCGKIQDVLLRQYSNRKECFNEFVYLSHLYHKLPSDIDEVYIKLGTKILLQYITTAMLVDNLELTPEEFNLCLAALYNLKVSLLAEDKIIPNLYQVSSSLLTDYRASNLQSKVLAYSIRNVLTKTMYNSDNRVNMCKMHHILDVQHYLQGHYMEEMRSRLVNKFYETCCEVVYQYTILFPEMIQNNIAGFKHFLDNVTQIGGYGCLKWNLKIMKNIHSKLIENEKYDLEKFLNSMWKEIEEIKSNKQHLICMEAFIDLLLLDDIIKNPSYNNLVLFYFKSIVEYGSTSVGPLNYLVKALDSKIDLDCSQLIFILHEILLFAPVLRKDQRITEQVILRIIGENTICPDFAFNYQVQQSAVSILLKISEEETLQSIIKLLLNKIDVIFKNKVRYHGDSQPHRTLLTALQHVLFTSLIQSNCVKKELLDWCVMFMNKLPHQPSVKLCLEWIMAIYLIVHKLELNEETLRSLNILSLPLLSQMFILYLVLKHRIIHQKYKEDEYKYIMDFLMSHSMGQLFNVRLLAQYLSMKLYDLHKHNRYEYTMDLISKTFLENKNEKSLIKLKNDFFANNFDVVEHLTPTFVYFFLPRYYNMDGSFRINSSDCVEYIKKYNNTDLVTTWLNERKTDDEVIKYKTCKENKLMCNDDLETNGTIQKKYIPWRNMSDVETCNTKTKNHQGELIVVASLVDKIPNLGGIARTSEVFGVKTYVVDSLRHLQDKQFQGLSVSAEKWVDVEEVRPGKPLKEYLARMKSEGYVIVAAEQTSNSVLLPQFKFPMKTLLLLGHEKEGVPCDLLPYMDYCVEIPQQGFVRSLNVHVTAAIFVWEYARQNFL